MIKTIVILFLAALLALPLASQAQSTVPATSPLTTQTHGSDLLTVAILDFAANVPGSDDLGKEIGETLTATLSGEPGISLVDRASLTRTLQEHELNLTGLVAPDQAAQIGKLVGARILVTGKAFSLDKSVFITAKIIGTETSLVEGVLVKGNQGDDLGAMVLQLSDKLILKIHQAGPSLVAGPGPIDPLPELKSKLVGLKLPKITLEISEQHISPQRVIDPAVDTELRKMLIDCGFTVIDRSEVTPATAGIKIAIKGEGISELAGHIGNLVSCTGRVELSVVNDSNGQILYTDRTTSRAVDLSEQIAGKSALQKAAHEMGIALLRHFAQTLPKRNNER